MVLLGLLYHLYLLFEKLMLKMQLLLLMLMLLLHFHQLLLLMLLLLLLMLLLLLRGLIQVGVNVTASTGTPGKKNRPSRPRGGPVPPVRLHCCTHWSNVTLLCFAYNID